jgi:hypothetical protein
MAHSLVRSNNNLFHTSSEHFGVDDLVKIARYDSRGNKPIKMAPHTMILYTQLLKPLNNHFVVEYSSTKQNKPGRSVGCRSFAAKKFSRQQR